MLRTLFSSTKKTVRGILIGSSVCLRLPAVPTTKLRQACSERNLLGLPLVDVIPGKRRQMILSWLQLLNLKIKTSLGWSGTLSRVVCW